MVFSPVLYFPVFSLSYFVSINFLPAKSIFNTAASAACTVSHSQKLQGMKEFIQYARDRLYIFLIKAKSQ